MLRKIRIILATVFFIGITILLLDTSGALVKILGWLAKLQFLPAVMAMNLGIIIFVLLLTLVFGRIYCSVICPLGVMQDGISHVRVSALRRKHNRRPFNFTKENKWFRYGVLFIVIVAILLGVQAAVALIAPYSAYGRIVTTLLQPVWLAGNNLLAHWAEKAGSYAFFAKELAWKGTVALIVALVTLGLVGFLAWKGGRTWCNTVCPVGTVLGLVSRFSLFRPVIDSDKCKNCKACEHNCKASCIDISTHSIDSSRCVDCFNCLQECKFDALHYKFAPGLQKKSAPIKEEPAPETHSGRRAFITGAALAVGGATLRAQEKKVDGGYAVILDKKIPERDTPLTPPGSKSVKDFYKRCTACQLCVTVCKNNVLRPSTDLKRLMQPEMSFEKGYCRPECVACGEVCPSGAISRLTPEEKTTYRVGVARVDRDLCVIKDGVSCGLCSRKCPVGAIRMVSSDEDGPKFPAIAEELCIGCGKCENLCPARPLSAITVNGRPEHLTD